MNTILLVEDDQSLGATLQERLSREGYEVSWARSVRTAEEQLRSKFFSLAIVDVLLPDGSGFDLGKKIKGNTQTALIFVTAMNAAEHRLQGYELGADEYIPKPFHLRELLLLIKRVLTRSNKAASRVNCGNISIDFDSMSIQFADGTVEYPTSRDFKLLALLVKAAPRVVSRDEVLHVIFPPSEDQSALPTQRTIDNSILRLRNILKKGGEEYIRSVRGVGYQWVAVMPQA